MSIYKYIYKGLSPLHVHGTAFEEDIAHQTATYRHTNKFANEHVPSDDASCAAFPLPAYVYVFVDVSVC